MHSTIHTYIYTAREQREQRQEPKKQWLLVLSRVGDAYNMHPGWTGVTCVV